VGSASSWRKIELHDEFEAAGVSASVGRYASALAFDPSGVSVAMGVANRVVVHDVKTGARTEEYVLGAGLDGVISVEMGADILVSKIVLTADGRVVVGAEVFRDDLCIQHTMLEVFERRTGALRFRVIEPVVMESMLPRAQAMLGGGWLKSGCSAWSVSPDGAQLVVGSYDGSIELIDALSGQVDERLNAPSLAEGRELEHREYCRPLRGVAFDPGGETIASARWLSIGQHGAYDVEVYDARTLERRSCFRFFRESLVSDVERVFGPAVKMATSGAVVRMSPEDNPSNSITDVLPVRGRLYRTLSLMEFRVVDMSGDGELVLCWLSKKPFHAGQPWYRLARFSQGAWDALDVPTVMVSDADETQQELTALAEEALSNEPLQPSSVNYAGGALSRDGQKIAVASEGFVLVGPCRRPRSPLLK
jgi:hypothetical protein